ncbi:MAG: tRNA threonylcarbamoyladenosine dehydratase [Bacilli bacterium]|nr:tRNA threonylcarbamoyladenosine dehydratase [Bacilli bacterium]
MNLSRLESLVGEENIQKIKNLKVLILGLGGVGGYTVESLVRCGINNITLVDGDTIKPSNINRQIIATSKNNNKYKTKEWKKRIKKINPDAIVNIINTMINEDNMEILFSEHYDYIVDCCDTSKVKIKLIKECYNKGIKVVSSMGMANKMDATKIIISTLDKTETDPLAKKIRSEIRNKEIMRNVPVVYSNEKPINNTMLGSTSFVPAVAGLYITNYIINDIIK